jgi:hypothetical protein
VRSTSQSNMAAMSMALLSLRIFRSSANNASLSWFIDRDEIGESNNSVVSGEIEPFTSITSKGRGRVNLSICVLRATGTHGVTFPAMNALLM